MKRTGPPARKTPLSQGDKPLARTTPLSAGDKPLARRTPPTVTPKERKQIADTGPTPDTRAVVHARSGGMCERCHNARVADTHHRCGRQMGGSRNTPWINLPSALADLCDPCHDEVTFGDLDAAVIDGWVVKRGEAEQADGCQSFPVTDLFGRRWLLLDDGRKVLLSGGGAV